MTAPDPAHPSVYASALESYWQLGWPSMMPLPPRQKASPPEGLTGWEGDDPSYADMFAWAEERPGANIALRMPPDVIGIDVDHYKGKLGGNTLAEHEAKWGPLPPTWRSTSRDDKVSGIRFFAVPPGLGWVGGLPSIELIHRGHRYAVVAPSIHPEGRPYRWIDPGGATSLVNPSAHDMPPLPAAWLIGLSTGPHVAQARADLDGGQAAEWVMGLAGHEHAPCAFMASWAVKATQAITAQAEARHDVTRNQVLALVRFGEQGHVGLDSALDRVRATFIRLVTADNSRTLREASSEWQRILTGAIRIVVANPEITMTEGDPCPPVLPTLKIDKPQPISPVPTRSETFPERVTGPSPAEMIEAELTRSRSSERVNSSAPEPEPERSSWWAHDLSDVLSGAPVLDGPTHFARTDGVYGCYAGEINGFIGAPESGKSWAALEESRQSLERGEHVVYLDFESSPAVMVERLRALGVPDEVIAAQVHYCTPQESYTGQGESDVTEMFRRWNPSTVVFDGVNIAMSLMGLKIDSNDDASEFKRKVLDPLRSGGACLITVDHVKKNDDGTPGAIGAQGKRAFITGVQLTFRVIKPFGRGQRGEIAITVDKDRRGHVRGSCSVAPEGGRQVFGTMEINSDPESEMVSVRITPEDTYRESVNQRATVELLTTISDYLSHHGDTKKSDLPRLIGKRREETYYAVRTLEGQGCVYTSEQSYQTERRMQKAMFCHLVRPYQAPNTRSISPVPTRSDPFPERVTHPFRGAPSQPPAEGVRDGVRLQDQKQESAGTSQPQPMVEGSDEAFPLAGIDSGGWLVDASSGEVLGSVDPVGQANDVITFPAIDPIELVVYGTLKDANWHGREHLREKAKAAGISISALDGWLVTAAQADPPKVIHQHTATVSLYQWAYDEPEPAAHPDRCAYPQCSRPIYGGSRFCSAHIPRPEGDDDPDGLET